MAGDAERRIIILP